MNMEYYLDELFDLQMGKTPARNNPEYWNSNDYKWISIGDLSKCGKYISETKEFLSEQAVKDSGISLIPTNTVIMSFKLSIGKTAITTEPMYSNEAIMSFRDKKTTELIPDYIYYLFSGKDWDVGTNKAVMGKTLNKATLSKTKVHIHSIDIQKEIVEILDNVVSIMNTRKQQLAKFDELVKARFVEMFGDPENNPYKWDKTTVGDVCSSIVRGPFGSALKKEFFVEPNETTYKVYEQKHAIQKSATIGTYYVTAEKFKELKRFECVAGDILMSCSGTMGELYQLPVGCEKGLINQALCKFTLNDKILPIVFLTYMKQTIGNLETKGSGIQNIAAVSYVKAMPINLPPMNVQEQFASFVEQTDKSKAAVQKALDEAQTLFDSLMQQYFG
ncbi:MAG: restriction endonuclease subunit S [Clostridia bacterium]|nr:restriction endonuclease subunit S [Clostridia bacterium]